MSDEVSKKESELYQKRIKGDTSEYKVCYILTVEKRLRRSCWNGSRGTPGLGSGRQVISKAKVHSMSGINLWARLGIGFLAGL
jgi:hypothetical protein